MTFSLEDARDGMELRAAFAAALRERDELRRLLTISINAHEAYRSKVEVDLARVTDERDAAVRERDEARGNLGGYVIVGGPQHVEMWNAINAFTVASGGRADAVNGDRMDAVVRIERVVSSMVARGESRRPGPTLTAEERAALADARTLVAHQMPTFMADAIATIDRLLAGARTVTAADVERWTKSVAIGTFQTLAAVDEADWRGASDSDREAFRDVVRAILADLGIEVTP